MNLNISLMDFKLKVFYSLVNSFVSESVSCHDLNPRYSFAPSLSENTNMLLGSRDGEMAIALKTSEIYKCQNWA